MIATAPAMDAAAHQRFADMLETHRGLVFKVANAYARNAEDRQDLAQDIAAQLWRAWPGYDAARPLSTWMYRIALNVAISHLRGRSGDAMFVAFDPERYDDAAQGDSDAGLLHEQDERVRLLHRVIARQPPLDRALLLLWLDERSQREIAEVLGLSESNVSTKLNRLKQRLREQLAASDFT